MESAPSERIVPEDSAEALADLRDRNSRYPEMIVYLNPNDAELQNALVWLIEDGLEDRA